MTKPSSPGRPAGIRRRPHWRRTAPLAIGILLTALVAAPSSVAAQPTRPADERALAQHVTYAPTCRTLAPVAVYTTSGTVTAPTNVLSGQPTRISGANSSVVLDFGREVGGIVTLSFAGASAAGQQVGLAFSESSLYVGESSDLSSGAVYAEPGTDGALTTTVNGATSYTMPTDKLRGGF